MLSMVINFYGMSVPSANLSFTGLPDLQVELTCYAATNSEFEDVLGILSSEMTLLSSDWKVIRLKCE